MTCPVCQREIRPCNLARHRRARHLPRAHPARYGRRFTQPEQPILDRSMPRFDEVAPRGRENYYRVYRLRGGDLQLLATAKTPSGFGMAIADLWKRGEFIVDDSTGVFDSVEETWIMNPWNLGRRREP